MPKVSKPLTDKALKGFLIQDKKYTVFDGLGLHIEICPNGSKLWRLAFSFDGKSRRISLGRYPDISLSLAREIAQKKRALIAQGIDPIEFEKKQRKETNGSRIGYAFNRTLRVLLLWHNPLRQLSQSG